MALQIALWNRFLIQIGLRNERPSAKTYVAYFALRSHPMRNAAPAVPRQDQHLSDPGCCRTARAALSIGPDPPFRTWPSSRFQAQ